MLLLGENFDATQALQWRFVEHVTPRHVLDEVVQAWVRQILSGGPSAVRLQKALLRSWEDLPLRDAVTASLCVFAAAYDTDEPQSMMRRFLDAEASRKARA